MPIPFRPLSQCKAHSTASYILHLSRLAHFGVPFIMYILIAVWLREQEISDDLMASLSLLLSSRLPPESISAQRRSYVTYMYASSGDDAEAALPITLLESRSIISGSGTTGLRTWEAALAMSEYLMTKDGRALIRNKKVLELGAGTGLLSILCAKYLEAGRVVATDGDEGVVEALNTNVFLNGLEGLESMDTSQLLWGRTLPETVHERDDATHSYDVVLGADIVRSPRRAVSKPASHAL